MASRGKRSPQNSQAVSNVTRPFLYSPWPCHARDGRGSKLHATGGDDVTIYTFYLAAVAFWSQSPVVGSLFPAASCLIPFVVLSCCLTKSHHCFPLSDHLFLSAGLVGFLAFRLWAFASLCLVCLMADRIFEAPCRR